MHLATSSYSAQLASHCVTGDVCYSVNVPETSASSGNGDIFFQISGPSELQYIALGQAGQGAQMAGVRSFRSLFVPLGSRLGPTTGSGSTLPSPAAWCHAAVVIYTANANSVSLQANIFIVFADASGSNVTLSPRYADLGDLQSFSLIMSKYNSHYWKYYQQWLSISIALPHVKALGTVILTSERRLGTGNREPGVDDSSQATLLSGSGISDGKMTANVRCTASHLKCSLLTELSILTREIRPSMPVLDRGSDGLHVVGLSMDLGGQVWLGCKQ